MGDRCYIWITCPRAQRKIVENIVFGDFDEEHELVKVAKHELQYISLGFAEVNGSGDVINNLTNAGVIFVGRHSEGCDYDPHVFAYDGESLEECPTIQFYQEGQPAIHVTPSGDVDEEMLDAARKYWQVFHTACEKMGVPDDDFAPWSDPEEIFA